MISTVNHAMNYEDVFLKYFDVRYLFKLIS